MDSPRRWTGQAAPQWGVSPPPPRVRKYERLQVISTKPITLHILSDQLAETFTHFVDSRTVFCTGHESGCWLDHADVGRPRYGAWLAVQPIDVKVTQLLCLTAVAVSVEARLRLLAGRLRGMTLQVWRCHPHARAEMHSKLLVDVPPATDLRSCPDVRFCVERMIEAEDRKDGKNRPKWGILRAGSAAAAAAAAAAGAGSKGGAM